MKDPEELRILARWYRALAERTANPTVWEARLITAEDLEAEAERIESIVAATAHGHLASAA
jgi:hypothetical protein